MTKPDQNWSDMTICPKSCNGCCLTVNYMVRATAISGSNHKQSVIYNQNIINYKIWFLPCSISDSDLTTEAKLGKIESRRRGYEQWELWESEDGGESSGYIIETKQIIIITNPHIYLWVFYTTSKKEYKQGVCSCSRVML